MSLGEQLTRLGLHWKAGQLIAEAIKVEKGVSAARPTYSAAEYGRMYLDTTLDPDGLPIFWNGTKWIKSDGSNA